MLTIASICTGGGGADIGFAMAGFTPIWGIEIDQQIAAIGAKNLERHNPQHQMIVADVGNVDPYCLQRPDVLWCSPSCQTSSSSQLAFQSLRGVCGVCDVTAGLENACDI